MFEVKQYISKGLCLTCLGCCRYNCNSSIWAPVLLQEERQLKNLHKLTLVAYHQSYICCFLDPKSNRCKIYTQRPLECRLYPFLLTRCGRELYLGLDLKCPYISDRINNREFKSYLNYLIRYLQKPLVLTTLIRNLRFLHSYPAGEILNLSQLRI
jgi:Fe-S-cluster containining protein